MVQWVVSKLLGGTFRNSDGSCKEATAVVVKDLYRPYLYPLFFLLAFFLVYTDSHQGTRVELAPARAVEVAQVATCTQKTMTMTCMAK